MIERMDCFIYDMNSGRLDDLEFAVKSLTKDPLESEKTLIVISSVLEWAGNEHKIVEDKPEPKDDENNEEKQEENKDEDIMDANNAKVEDLPEEERLADDEEWEELEVPDEENIDEEADEEENKKKTKIIRVKRKKKPEEIKYKRIGYSEEEFKDRIPIDSFAKIKKFEDHLMNLKYENLNIYIICAGIPYGNAETVFNYFFKVT